MSEAPSSPLDLLPKNRREVVLLVIGTAIAFGLQKLPGVTIEPQELSECKLALGLCESRLEAAEYLADEQAGRIARCWSRYHGRFGEYPADGDDPYTPSPEAPSDQ